MAGAGNGNGIIVQRGFPHPPSYYSEKLRDAPNQHFYDVITQRLRRDVSPTRTVSSPPDRWAITAYIRALQASASATLCRCAARQAGARCNEANPIGSSSMRHRRSPPLGSRRLTVHRRDHRSGARFSRMAVRLSVLARRCRWRASRSFWCTI